MLKNWLCFSLVMSSLGIHELQGVQEKPLCGNSPRPVRITARHIDPKGIGYNQGYTTLEGFFTPQCNLDKPWVPFLDLRGHVFNNGKLAANAGLGLRYVDSSWVYGVNAYYDYRQTHRFHYNQVSAGLEALGKLWDIRINGYLPVGKKQSSLFSPHFYDFKGNSIISRKQEFTFKGANAELGAHIKTWKHVALYAAAGPYYLAGKGKTAWGGEGRVSLDLFDYVRLEGNASYDRIFKGIVQGQLSLILPLGRRAKIRQRTSSCHNDLVLRERSVQPVYRNEIIPVHKRRITDLAIDPATGLPYFFVFVDNTSHSLGTYESPFNTLLAAQNGSGPNDVIYVFSGDGTSTGMNSGITLQTAQQMLGSGMNQSIATTLGTIAIPKQTATSPTITNLAGDAVSLVDNNIVSGFIIDSPSGHAIASGSLTNSTITNNTILNTGAESIYLNGTFLTGNIFITNNNISNSGAVKGVFVQSTDQLAILNILQNSITTGSDALDLEIHDSATYQSYIVGNTLISTSGTDRAFFNACHDNGQHEIVMTSNTCTGEDGIFFEVQDNAVVYGNIGENQLINNINAGLRLDPSGTSLINVSVNGNQFLNNILEDFISTGAGTSTTCLRLKNNFAPTIGYTLENSGATINLTSNIGNVGPFNESGTITRFPTCP